MRDDVTINGVRFIAEIEGKEANIRPFGAPAVNGGHLLDIEEWYRLTASQVNSARYQRERDRLRELSPRPCESTADYKIRLEILIDRHLGDCRDCNYDNECTACAADYEGDAHNCNCGHMPGYGWQLNESLNLARLAIKAESKS